MNRFHIGAELVAELFTIQSCQALPDLGTALSKYAIREAVHDDILKIDVVTAYRDCDHTRRVSDVLERIDLSRRSYSA